MNLQDRINRIIHTTPFEEALEAIGMDLFEFQSEWARHAPNALPVRVQMVILYAEHHWTIPSKRRLSAEQMKLADEAQTDAVRRELIIFQTL